MLRRIPRPKTALDKAGGKRWDQVGRNSIHGTAYAFGRDAAYGIRPTTSRAQLTATMDSLAPRRAARFSRTSSSGLRTRAARQRRGRGRGLDAHRRLRLGPSISMVDACNLLASSTKGVATAPYNAIGVTGPGERHGGMA